MKYIYIITPCYNAAETIEETLHSVFNQCGDYTIHYHVQDGGSTDGTQEKIKRFMHDVCAAKADGTFIFSWSSQPDKGMYDAINLAVEQFNIPEDAFMGWINADDLLYENCLRHLSEVVRAFPQVQWVGGRSIMMDISGNIIGKGDSDWYNQIFIQNGLCDGFHWAYIQQEGTFWQKRLWNAAGGVNTKLRLAGDWDLWRRMARHAPYIQVPWHMGVFRKHPGQLSQNLSAYQEEIAGLAPREARSKSLLRVCPYLSSLSAPTVMEGDCGTIRLAEIPLNPSWKMKIRLWLWGLGLYSFVSFCQGILRSLKGCKA